MDEKRRVEVATLLVASYVEEKGTRLIPYVKMKRKLDKLANDMGVKDWTLHNFVRTLFDYLTARSFSDEVTVKKNFDIAVDLGHIEDVAIKTCKQLLKENGFHLKPDNRRMNQIAQYAGISRPEIVAILNPLLHQIVDEIVY